ncbi:MAG TPA: hypothetical protein VI299_29950 [Polyangiales bacterium]
MNNAWWPAIAALAFLACGDGTIGKELCISVACDERPDLLVEQLVVDFEEVSTIDPATLPAPSWRIPNPCAVAPCNVPARLFAARDGSVWSIARGTSVPTVESITPEGTRTTRSIEVPSAESTIRSAYFTGRSDGSLLGHLQWSQPTGRSYEETVEWFDAAQPPQRTLLDPASTQPRPPAAIAAAQGFLLFDDGVVQDEMSFNVVRNVARDGEVVWQQGSFPQVAAIVGGSAVATSTHYLLSASPNSTGTTLYRMLWLDPLGTVRRVTEVSGATWRGLSFFDRGADRYLAVAPSDITAAGDGSQGNIDLVFFTGAQPTRGVRLRRDCFYALALNGYGIDRDGNAYVSSIAGVRGEPRGLLCRLPDRGVARCYQSEPMRSLGALVVLDEDTVIAAMDDEIVRIDLP